MQPLSAFKPVDAVEIPTVPAKPGAKPALEPVANALPPATIPAAKPTTPAAPSGAQ
jgi:hypothetical protein